MLIMFIFLSAALSWNESEGDLTQAPSPSSARRRGLIFQIEFALLEVGTVHNLMNRLSLLLCREPQHPRWKYYTTSVHPFPQLQTVSQLPLTEEHPGQDFILHQESWKNTREERKLAQVFREMQESWVSFQGFVSQGGFQGNLGICETCRSGDSTTDLLNQIIWIWDQCI